MPIAASKAVFAVLALGAGSVLGYNWMTTGCPSGVCPTERAAAKVIPAAMSTESEAMSCSTEKADACCPLTAEATVMNVSATTESCATACEDKSACDTEPAMTAVANTAAAAADAPACCDDLPNCCMEKEDCCGSASANTEQTASNAP